MTRLELNEILVCYAQEDMGYARDGGQVAIAQTLNGLITLEYCNNDCYKVLNRLGESITGLMNRQDTLEYLMGVYDCSDVEVIG